MADILQNTVKITVEGEEFEFRVPSPLDVAKVGMRAAAIRRNADPDGIGFEDGLDIDTLLVVRAMATMDVLLERSSAKWALSEIKDTQGNVKVGADSNKFPAHVTPMLPVIYQEVQEAIKRFLGRGTGNGVATGAEDMASQPDHPEKPV